MKEDEKNKYITLDENYYWNHTCVFNIIFYVKKKKEKKKHISLTIHNSFVTVKSLPILRVLHIPFRDKYETTRNA